MKECLFCGNIAEDSSVVCPRCKSTKFKVAGDTKAQSIAEASGVGSTFDSSADTKAQNAQYVQSASQVTQPQPQPQPQPPTHTQPLSQPLSQPQTQYQQMQIQEQPKSSSVHESSITGEKQSADNYSNGMNYGYSPAPQKKFPIVLIPVIAIAVMAAVSAKKK